MSTRCSRRTALKLMAASAAGASLPWLRSPSARAQSGEVPLRILFVDATHGCRRGTFEPNMPTFWASQDTAETNWAFRDVMAPLQPYQNRATMFQCMDMLSEKEDPSSAADAHVAGLTHMLTADNRHNGSANLGTGPSIDQFIAQELAQRGVNTKLQSLELAATDSATESRNTLVYDAYSAPGQKVPFMTYVPAVWDRLFSDPLTGNSQQQAVLNNRRALVHGFVRGEYDRLLGKVSPEDREKLMQMRDYRSDLFNSASLVNDRAANRPDRSTIITPWSQLNEGRGEGNLNNRLWKTHAELMAKLAAAALHTDSTRVVNLHIAVPPDYEIGYTPGSHGSSDLHDLDHQVSGDDPSNKDPAAGAIIDTAHRIAYERVAFLLNELENLKETDGKSLLDHTIVVVYSHIGEGSHDKSRLPWLVFGDAQGYFKTGQYVRFKPYNWRLKQDVNPNNATFKYQFNGTGRGHGDLFITLANAMGIPITTFGNSNVVKGPITQMLA